VHFDNIQPSVQLPQGGIEDGLHLRAFTITMEKWPGNPDPPFAVAYVQLMLNYVTGLDFSDIDKTAKSLEIGKRVKVIFKEKREGQVSDFEYTFI
jgi:uncharacterized OB-fold protein